jgi:hypothetical protein
MATSKKVIPLTSSQKPQGALALPEFCTHVACSHEEPHSETDLRDNVDMLLMQITALFEAMTEIDGGLAWIGVDLCKELARRVDMLDNAHVYFK